jgi:ribosomal protein S18 acetylase RimI-like enzyme
VILSTTEARRRLNLERHWCIYALGDLDPRRVSYSTWYGGDDQSVSLVYREFDTPIVFASGGTQALEAAMSQLDNFFVQIPLDHLDTVAAKNTLAWTRRMHRLRLDPVDFQPVDSSPVTLLHAADEDDIRALYADGAERNESPDFFFASQLDDATFHGVRLEDGTLAAAGGTHLYSAEESIGAIGNIYTHRDHRGRGYAAAITSAIAQTLIDRGIQTIALNVKQGNDGARRIYERLGFRHYRDYWEGLTANR